MPALAPVLLVAVLSFAAFATDSLYPPTPDPTSLLAQSAAVVGGEKEGEANSQCPKPKPGQKYFPTEDMSKWNRVIKDPVTKTEFFNLYGKPCEERTRYGGAIVVTVCTDTNFCNGSLSKAKCYQYDLSGTKRESVDCKLYQGKVKTAGYNEPGRGVCEGCTTGGGVPKTDTVGGTTAGKEVTTPAAPKQVTQGVDTAFRPAQGPVERGTIPKEFTSQARLNELAQGQPAPQVPKSGTVANTAGTVRLNPEIGRGVQGPTPIQPGQVPTGVKTGTNPFRPLPTAQTTFPKSPITQNVAKTPSLPTRPSSPRSMLNRLFSGSVSLTSIVSGVTNFVSAVVAPPKQSTAIQQATQAQPRPSVQNTQLPQPVIRPVTTAGQQNAQLPLSTASAQLPADEQDALDVGSSTVRTDGRPLVYATSRSSVSIFAIDDLVGQGSEDDIQDPETPVSSTTGTSRTENASSSVPIGVAPSIPAPVLAGPIASTSAQNAHDTFAERIAQLEALKVVNTDFKPASTTQRTTSVVELFSEISIPDILTAITKAPGDFLRRVLGRGVPEARVVSTELPTQPIERIADAAPPTFGSTQQAGEEIPVPTGTSVGSSNMPGIQEPAVPAREVREVVRERLQKEPEAAFRDVSPAHQGDGYVPLAKPGNIYPNVVPVPQPKQEEAHDTSIAGEAVGSLIRSVKGMLSNTWSWLSSRGQ